jgi:hypothetical protein
MSSLNKLLRLVVDRLFSPLPIFPKTMRFLVGEAYDV